MSKKKKIIEKKEETPITYADISLNIEDERIESLANFLKEIIDEEDIARSVKEKAREALLILANGNGSLDVKLQRIILIFESLNEDLTLDQFSRIKVWNLMSFIETLA